MRICIATCATWNWVLFSLHIIAYSILVLYDLPVLLFFLNALLFTCHAPFCLRFCSCALLFSLYYFSLSLMLFAHLNMESGFRLFMILFVYDLLDCGRLLMVLFNSSFYVRLCSFLQHIVILNHTLFAHVISWFLMYS